MKLSIGTPVTAWINPKNYKSNTGEDGIIIDVYKSLKGTTSYMVQLNNNRGRVLSSANKLTILTD